MIFSPTRRRFLAIATASVGALFVPGATTGAVGDLILSEKDRYAETVRMINESMGTLPDAYWKNRAAFPSIQALLADPEWRERHTAFLAKSDELFKYMLSAFDEKPSVEQVRPLFEMAEAMPGLNVDDLKTISAGLVPIAVVKSMIAYQRAPYHVDKMEQFGAFVGRYKHVIIEAASAPRPAHA